MQTQKQDVETIIGGYEGRFLVLISFATMSGNGAQLLLPPLLPSIINDLAISPTMAGLSLSTMWFSTALFHYPGGRLSDILTRKSILVPSIGMMTLGLLTFIVIPHPIAFYFGLLLLGIGAGLYTPVAFAQLTDLYIRRRGVALGINTASLNFGGMLGAGLAVVSVQLLSWRQAFIPASTILIIVLISIHYLSEEQYEVNSIQLDLKKTLLRLMSSSDLRRTLLAAGIFGFVWQSILSFLPIFLHSAKGFSTTTAGIIFGGIFLIGAITTPIAGQLGDSFGYIIVAIITILITSGGLFLVIIGNTQDLILVGVIVLATGLSGFWPAINTQIMNIFNQENLGGDYGATRAVFIASESIGPFYLGFTGENLSFLLGFKSLLIPLAFTLIATISILKIE